jgi:hypothetical protein
MGPAQLPPVPTPILREHKPESLPPAQPASTAHAALPPSTGSVRRLDRISIPSKKHSRNVRIRGRPERLTPAEVHVCADLSVRGYRLA